MDLITLCQDNKRACDNCRLRKVKCDFEADACSSCVRRGVLCTFLEKPKPRGRRKKHNISDPQHNNDSTQEMPHELSFSDQQYAKSYEENPPSSLPSTIQILERAVSDPSIPHFRDIEQYSLKRSSASTTQQLSPVTSSQSAGLSPSLY